MKTFTDFLNEEGLLNRHRVQVTASKDDGKKEKINVNVTATSKREAQGMARLHLQKKGYKTHSAIHLGYDHKFWNKESVDMCNVCGQTPCNCTHLSEAFKVGDIVIPDAGPHKGQKHEVIHDHGDGTYNIKPQGVKNVQYRHGAVRAKTDQIKLHEEAEQIDELTAWSKRGKEDPRSYPTSAEKAARRGQGDVLHPSPEEVSARKTAAAYGHKNPTASEKNRLKSKIKLRLSDRTHKYNKPSLPEETEMGDAAHTKTMKHRVLVTYSDPHHSAASMRKEKVQKHLLVPSTNKNGESIYKAEAEVLAKKHMKKQGYKVHEVEHVGLVTKKVNEEVEQIDELSNELLASYKKKAGEDASKQDKEGNFDKGHKRFKGIMKATFKQFANDAKK